MFVNVYHAGFDDAKSLLDEHRLNQVKEQDQENLYFLKLGHTHTHTYRPPVPVQKQLEEICLSKKFF